MNNISQSFAYPKVKDTSGQSLAEPRQKAHVFANHFAGVNSDDNNTDFREHKADFK